MSVSLAAMDLLKIIIQKKYILLFFVSISVIYLLSKYNAGVVAVSSFVISKNHVFPLRTKNSECVNPAGTCRHPSDYCNIELDSNEDEQLLKFLQSSNDMFKKSRGTSWNKKSQILEDFIGIYNNKNKTILRYFASLNKTKEQIQYYDWKVFQTKCRGTNDIIISIQETFRNKSTSGGSSFTILQTSAHTKDFCPIVDLFNGTYIAKCSTYGSKTTISGIVQFVNFTAFSKTTKAFKKIILNYNEDQNGNSRDTAREHWISKDNEWRWWTPKGLVPRTDGVKLKKCMKRYSNVKFIGDSHVRFWYRYFLKRMNILTKSLRYGGSYVHVEKFEFFWGNYVNLSMSVFQKEIKLVRNENNSNKNKTTSKEGKVNETFAFGLEGEMKGNETLFIMNSLHWDAERTNIATYISGIQQYAKLLQNTKKTTPFTRVIFLSGVAFPSKYLNNPILNVYLLRALNKVAKEIMQNFGVETFDVSDMLYSVNDYVVDRGHYLIIKPPGRTIQGLFGPAAADSIVQYICKKNSNWWI